MLSHLGGDGRSLSFLPGKMSRASPDASPSPPNLATWAVPRQDANSVTLGAGSELRINPETDTYLLV